MNKYYRLLRYDWPMHFVLLLTNWLPDNVCFIRLRGFLARPFFNRCGPHLGLGRNITFYNPSRITLGSWVYIAYGCWFSASGGCEIEDEVLFGPYNVVATSDHGRKNGSFRFGAERSEPIRVGRGAWIGAHCCLLRGSRVGRGAVVAANTIVSGVVPDNSVFAGPSGEVRKTYDT